MSRLQGVAIERLDDAVRRYEEIGRELSEPATFEDTRHAAELGREQAELSDLVDRYATYRSLTTQ
ncbi:MAG: hypothetical protein JO023_05145, partial [Chloroflexi bacterium]|nr:hypothetical protein [Chloroflexota bacterium]